MQVAPREHIKFEKKEVKKEPDTKKSKGAIDSMFGKQKQKEKESETEKTTSSKPAATSKATAPAAKKNTGIAGLFAKQSAAGPAPKKPVKQESEPEVEDETSPVNSPGKENRVNQERERKEREEKERRAKVEKEKEERERKAKVEKERKEKENAKKRPKKNSNSGNQAKKRKRIQVSLL